MPTSSKGVALAAHGIGKAYRISQSRERHATLAETLLYRLLHLTERQVSELFWALDDVSLEVAEGEVVGLIGRNGAGKSTLLKILSRITPPTRGSIEVFGRVGSLLEVGTGFHAELTGRENIFLNGAILGMRRGEILRQFDSIVEFAEVAAFLDTPVKRYSSGMYVRLAFAVAAHLNPEILVVDEVLAVGDAKFQQSCLGKMKEVSQSGRTVIFVSHNMNAIRNLCHRAVLLQRGQVLFNGPVEACVEKYALDNSFNFNAHWERRLVPPDSPLFLTQVACYLEGDQPDLVLRLECRLKSQGKHRPGKIHMVMIDFSGAQFMHIIPTDGGRLAEPYICDDQGEHEVTIRVFLPPMLPGQYGINMWVGSHDTEQYDAVPECVGFDIKDSPIQGSTTQYNSASGY
ncbi:MAG TPA: ABC transporter ATP-binding protein, partial [Candidatus Xenobia bacterium]